MAGSSNDLEQFTKALDENFQSFSSSSVPIDVGETNASGQDFALQLRNLSAKYDQQLQRARAAFIQSFKTHETTVASEVKKIQKEIAQQLDKAYADKIMSLRKISSDSTTMLTKCKDEIAYLKSLASSQEAHIAALRNRWNVEQQDVAPRRVKELDQKLSEAKKQMENYDTEIWSREEMIEMLEQDGKKQQREFQVIVDDLEARNDQTISLMQAEQKQHAMREAEFHKTLQQFEKRFFDYRSQTEKQLQLGRILLQRKQDALEILEKEREKHERQSVEAPCGLAKIEDYKHMDKGNREPVWYRKDLYGMDESWKEYTVHPPRRPRPGPSRDDPFKPSVRNIFFGPPAPKPKPAQNKKSV